MQMVTSQGLSSDHKLTDRLQFCILLYAHWMATNERSRKEDHEKELLSNGLVFQGAAVLVVYIEWPH